MVLYKERRDPDWLRTILIELGKQFTKKGKDDGENERADHNCVEAGGKAMGADKQEKHRGHHQIALVRTSPRLLAMAQ